METLRPMEKVSPQKFLMQARIILRTILKLTEKAAIMTLRSHDLCRKFLARH